MTDNDKMREAIIKILNEYTHEMEHYDYYKSNLGVSVDDYEDIADEIIAWQAAQAVPADEDSVISIASAYESGIGHCNDDLCNPYSKDSAEAMAYDIGKEFGKSRGIDKRVTVVARSITGGRWHHGNGVLCMGTLRIAREDFDTDPDKEVKDRIFDELCAVINAAPMTEVV